MHCSYCLHELEYSQLTHSLTHKITTENASHAHHGLYIFIGFWLADVMGDSVVAEKARLEPTFAKGITQSSCYSYRFFGYMVAGPVSTGLYKYFGPKVVIFLLSALPFSILPLVCTLGEVRYGQVASTKDQCKEIWNTVCSR